MTTAVIILAAGQGSRMKSDLPKVLHKVAGAPMLWHAMQRARQIEAEKTVVVVGHGGELAEKSALEFDSDAIVVWQNAQNGTGHAVQQTAGVLKGFEGDAVVLYGDTPFIQPETLEKMLAARIPCGPYLGIDEVAKDPHIRDQNMIEYTDLEVPGLEEVPVCGIPIRLSKTPGRVETRAPRVGEHNEAVYQGNLGYSPEKMEDLKSKGAI